MQVLMVGNDMIWPGYLKDDLYAVLGQNRHVSKITTNLLVENNPDLLFHCFCRSEVQVGSTGFSALGFTFPKSRCQTVGLFLRESGKNLLPRSSKLLVESSYLWLSDWGPYFLAGCQPGVIFILFRPFSFPGLWLSLLSKMAVLSPSPQISPTSPSASSFVGLRLLPHLSALPCCLQFYF